MLSQQFSQRNAGQGIIPSLELFQHALQNQQHFRAMLRGHAREVVWDAAQASLSRTIEQTLAATLATKRSPSVPLTVMSQYLAGAFLNLLKWWLEAEMPYSPAQMDEMFQQLACLECGQPLKGRVLLHREVFCNLVAHPVGRYGLCESAGR